MYQNCIRYSDQLQKEEQKKKSQALAHQHVLTLDDHQYYSTNNLTVIYQLQLRGVNYVYTF